MRESGAGGGVRVSRPVWGGGALRVGLGQELGPPPPSSTHPNLPSPPMPPCRYVPVEEGRWSATPDLIRGLVDEHTIGGWVVLGVRG